MDDNPLLTLFQKYKQPLFIGAALLVLAVTLTVRWTTSKQGGLHHDFAYARQLSSEMASNPKGVAIADFEEIVHRHRELQPEYDGSLAQYWIKGKNPEAAAPYVERILSRTGKQNPHYAQFARGTRLVAEGKKEQALVQAEALKGELVLKETPLLSALVTLRCALLQEDLGKPCASATWQELLVLLESHPKETLSLRSALRQGNISLMEYTKSKIVPEA